MLGRYDPAQLKASVTELLLPRMELGLLYAEVTEKICTAWTSTIVETIAWRMATASSISRHGFCLLSGIPYLWFRAQTIKITELLVDLNTRNCAAGATTRSRLRALRPKSSTSDILLYYRTHQVNKRAHNRIAGVLASKKAEQFPISQW